MLKVEKNYDFRQRMCQPHRRIYGWRERKVSADEYAVTDGVTISVEGCDEVALLAARDFADYLRTAFGIKAVQVKEGGKIHAYISPIGLSKNADGYMGRRITVSDSGIEIQGYDGRGIAQAFYSLEERMNTRLAPYLKKGTVEQRPAFSPRMTHSGYGMDMFPDEYLATLAHQGYDAILLFVKDAAHSGHGECDFNDIISRASKYGIDVYAYSYVNNFVHPEEEGAKEIYAEVYGGLFKSVPGFKGMIFVGESIEFPSNDPHVAKRQYFEVPEDGIPDGTVSPGWYPCNDYPQWISLVRDSIRAVKPDADIVFWTYNFGYVDREARVKLLRALPTDISLLVTYEMFDTYEMGNGRGMVMDYTISHVGPGEYFKSEAVVAKERGIKLYSMVNTGGRTWDFGVIPYEPFPEQWNERHKSILESREKYGLVGLMESHHYGFLPSFISRLTNNNFTLGGMSFEEKYTEIAMQYAGDEYEKFIEGMALVNESVKHYVPSDESQWACFRIGPAFPICLARAFKYPNEPGVHFGNAIYQVVGRNFDDWGNHDCFSLRVRAEIEEAKKSRDLVKAGLKILKAIKAKTEELERLINLISYIEKCYITGINAKSFYVWRYKLLSADTKPKLASAIRQLERIARAEIKNAESAIPLVKRDSSIGYECSMGYQCDEKALRWKIKQTNYIIDTELALYKKSVGDPSVDPGRTFKFPPDIRN
ncbi:MAG: hypothetical protein IJX97_00485 [Clostridia bacterium]|nr:hypothetical protein [Clostridia bacterium]